MTDRKTPPRSAAAHMVHGSAWMIALRWAIRLTGLVSTIILARLLTPADFGIVAIAMIVVGMLEILNQTGQKLAIIRHQNPTAAHYDSAWTVSVLIGFGIAVAIVAIAPLTKIYFHEPRAIVVMQCLALRAILGGLENIGTIDFRRDLQFNVFFLYNVYPKLISFVVTIGLALVLRNYWALVAGILTGQLAMTVLSFTMHPHRPRFSLEKVADIWSFSIWTFTRAIGNYLNTQVDQIAIGGISGAASMGRYSVATDVASSPSKEINDPMVAVLYPVMSKLLGDVERLRELYLRTLGWSAIICAAASVGVALVAPEMVHLVLGPKWVDVTPLMGWLALSAGVLGLSSGAYTLFDAVGLPHIGARMQWVRLVILAIAVFPVAFITRDLQMIAATRLIVTIVFMPTLFFAVGRTIDVSPRDYLRALWRPFAAAAIMAACVVLANRVLPVSGNLKLVIDIVLGGVSFNAAIFALWIASGQPPSPEQDLVAFFRTRGKKLPPPILADETIELGSAANLPPD
jgi:lipopolysaccharide exporter